MVRALHATATPADGSGEGDGTIASVGDACSELVGPAKGGGRPQGPELAPYNLPAAIGVWRSTELTAPSTPVAVALSTAIADVAILTQ